jgi:hypothetical protein
MYLRATYDRPMRLLAGAFCVLMLAAAPALAGPPGRWESHPAAPLPRQEAAFAELDGRLHLVGGFEYGAADSGRHDVFDPASDSWTPSVPLPFAEHHVQAAGIDGTLFVLGGLQTLGFVQSGRLYAFDGSTWSLRAGLPAQRARGAGAAVAHAGRLYYVGGLRDNEPMAMVDVYDPAADAWTALADMPTPRDHLGVAVVDGVLYAVGGRQAAFETEVATTEALDLRTGTWRTGRAPIPTPRGGFATGAVDGRIVTIGGESAAGVHEQVELYDPAADTWTTLAPMPLPRHGIQGAPLGAGVWIAGGGTDLNVAATGAIDVFYPPPRPQPITALTGGQPAPAAAAPPAVRPRLRILRARRGERRLVLSVRTPGATTIVARAGGRVLARRRLSAGDRRVVLRLRRALPRGKLVVRAAGLTRRARLR